MGQFSSFHCGVADRALLGSGVIDALGSDRKISRMC